MRYQVVIEHDSESGHYTGTVPGIPAIVVDATSREETLQLARDAIAWYLEEHPGEAARPTVQAHVESVEVGT